MKTFFFNYRKFCYRSKLIFYVVRTSEAFLMGILVYLVSTIFIKEQDETAWLITIFLIAFSTPVPYEMMGGFEVLRNKFLQKHHLTIEDLKN
jgi:hypothetical protein